MHLRQFIIGRVRHSRARLIQVAVACALSVSLAAGCGSCSKSGDETGSDEREADAGERARGDKDAGDDDPFGDRREAFGLPFPPEVLYVRDDGNKVRVQTDMSLQELKDYLKARLTDYEILDPGHEIRAVGLRDYMPQLYAYRYADRTHIVYMEPDRSEDDEQETEGDDDREESERDDGEGDRGDRRARAARRRPEPRPGSKPTAERKKGEPVRDTNEDGERIAPGARWGEPYTPPEGSPLDKKRFESNFGKPYGEWVAQ